MEAASLFSPPLLPYSSTPTFWIWFPLRKELGYKKMDKDVKEPLPQVDLSWEWESANHLLSLRRSSFILVHSEAAC